ncbi:amino acid adenylation domain-containing protein [Streptomyces sp. WMMC905]|uniref:amino acid adenylation domain-containing protein n=1 Tax=Streptomyces sp. WMMC905 TaxID=3404123 RepID=UPI003B95D559
MPSPERRPLLAAQEGVWAGHHLDPGSPAYNTAEYVRVAGPLDADALDRALHLTVAEVEALHVTFATDDAGRPWRIPTPTGDWRTHRADLTGEPDPRAAALAWMERDLARPVDLSRGPLFGHALLRTGPEEFLWYHRVHHIALDGFGLSLVARRVAEVYTALVAGDAPPKSGFGTVESVLAEERDYLGSARQARDRAYWATRYADRPAVASPAGRTALPARTFHRRVADLDPPGVARLRRVARELSATWSEVLIAVTVARLHRLTGAPEIVLSLPVSGRLGSASLRVPAMVRNILPLRVPVGPGDGLRPLTDRVARELRGALPHQRYRYERLRRDLRSVGGARRLSGPGVNIMPFPYDLSFAGLPGTVHNVSAGPVDDLSVNVYDRGDGTGLRIAVDTHPELYSGDETAAFLAGLLALVEEALTDPDRPLGGGPEHDVGPVLDGGPLPTPARPVPGLVAEQAERRGDAVALEHAGGTLTYAALFEAARDTAGRLTGCGVAPGDVVAIALPRGPEAVVCLLGVLLAGAAYCPIDPAAPAERTARLLTDVAPALVLTTDAHATDFGDHAVLLTHRYTGRRLVPEAALDTARPPRAPASPGGLAYLLHTSGSTGRPKGVAVGHDALAHFVAAATHRYGLRSEDRVLQFAPLHFDASVEEIFPTLCAGATLVLRDDDMTESVPGFLAACDRLRISVLDLPTAYWHEVAYAVSTGVARLPAGVRTVVVGGEAALPERVERWREAVGTEVGLLNTYGPTEATVVATVADLHDPELAPGDVPIGRPLPGVRAAVIDGELYLMGPTLADGYRPSVPDGSRFAPLTALPGAPRAYRTGDLARIGTDGQLRHLGRADTEFKISGHRVQPAEVESALVAHPRIREAGVVGRILPDGSRRLVAHVVVEPAGPPPTDIRAHLRARLPAALVPSTVVSVDRLPRTAGGKIDRTALSEPVAEPAAHDVGAGTHLERTITRVWGRVLGRGEPALDADVFDLGAQSLQAIQAANRLGGELGRDVKVAWLFRYPTAASLAAFLSDTASETATDGGSASGQRPEGAPGEAGGPGRGTTRGALAGPRAVARPAPLSADTVLEPDIRPGARTDPRTRPHRAEPRRILLTGATGFVGAHLLARLLADTRAEVVCAVRAPGATEARARLRTALARHGLTPDRRTAARIRALPADLGRSGFGLPAETLSDLAATCDAVFHNGATVSVMRDYATLRAVNTESTRQLLRLTAPRATPLHYVSTLSVAPPRHAAGEVPEAFLPEHDGLRLGYQRSKWASERLLEQAAERGLPVTVHRLGRVVGPVDTGYVNEHDFLWSVLRAGIPAGIVPDLFEDEVWTPVDFVARALTRLCLDPAAEVAGPVFHHATPPRVRLADVYGWVGEYGYRVRRLPPARWREELPRTADVAATTLAFLESDDFGAPADPGLGEVRADNVREGLRGSGVVCPPLDRASFFRCLDHCVTRGLLPVPIDPPAARRPASR